MSQAKFERVTSDGGPLGRRRREQAAAERSSAIEPETRTEEAGRPAPRSTPWGRPLPGVPTVADFESVGLSESAARGAHRRLMDGAALGFEEACLSASVWSGPRSLDEVRMRRLAETFAAPKAERAGQ